MKNTVCLTRDNEAFVSQHIGDLDNAGTRHMLEETVAYLSDILDVQPQAVAHDLHPDFYSTQFAQAYAAERGLPLYAVQHHHAHIAAVCAEHRITGPVLGLALDGVGLGADGSAWGGELLRVAGTSCERLGHLAPLTMPGGDRAAREPWRMAAAALFDMQRGGEIAQRFASQAGAETVHDMLQRKVNCVTTSSMGRLFDAAAGLLGVNEVQGYEGQAAMLLEGLADRHGRVPALAKGYRAQRHERARLRPAAGSTCRLQGCGLRRGPVPCHHRRGSVRMGAARGRRVRHKPDRAGRRLFPQRHPDEFTERHPHRRGFARADRAAVATQRRRHLVRPGQHCFATSQPGSLTMCLAIPARIEELTAPGNAIVNLGGVRKEISLALVDDAVIGDYVIVHVGYALQKLDREEAERTLELFAEMGQMDELRSELAGDAA